MRRKILAIALEARLAAIAKSAHPDNPWRRTDAVEEAAEIRTMLAELTAATDEDENTIARAIAADN
jgi:hypothetical protein